MSSRLATVVRGSTQRTCLLAASSLTLLTTATAFAQPAPGPSPTAAAAEPPAGGTAPEQDEPWYERFDLSAFVDGYVGLNYQFPKPQTPTPGLGGGNGFRAYDVSNGVALHWAGVDLAYPAEPFGGTLGLRFGPSSALYNASDAAFGLQFVKQAFLSVKPLGKDGELTIDFGKLDTPVGAEVADSQGNMNYTRGALYWYAQPLFHTGLRVAYDPLPELGLRLFAVNGWNDTVDNNTGKTFGLQVTARGGDIFAGYLTYLTGPEQPDTATVTCEAGSAFVPDAGCRPEPGAPGGDVLVDRDGANARFRHLVDLVLDFTPAESVRILVNADVGGEPWRPLGSSETCFVGWYGASLALQLRPTELFYAALRGEVLRDPDGLMTATGRDTLLGTATLTLGLRATSHFLVMIDNRVDVANAELFQKGVRDTSRLQATTTLGAIFTTRRPAPPRARGEAALRRAAPQGVFVAPARRARISSI
ncbi:MAG: outer membrane beta-barrel protein [Myxococcales bacterium]|nr:outer membrane beta-barrel protein [Myxococcales bacterium]